MKQPQKRPFLDIKSAIEKARRLEMTRNWLQVMRIWVVVALGYLDAGFFFFSHSVRTKEFSCVCCLLLLMLLAACCCYNMFLTLDPKKGCTTSTG